MFHELFSSQGFQTLASISTVFFFVIFVGILIWVALLKKDFTSAMGRLPLDDNGQSIINCEE
jgi:hypothetical protein